MLPMTTFVKRKPRVQMRATAQISCLVLVIVHVSPRVKERWWCDSEMGRMSGLQGEETVGMIDEASGADRLHPKGSTGFR